MNVIHRIQSPDGLIHKIEAPEDASPEALFQFIAQQPQEPPPPREVDDGFFDVLGYGTESALNRAGATWDTLTGDLEGVEQSAIDAQQIPQTTGQKEFRADLNANPEGSFTDEAVNLFNAVVDNPGGAWDEVVAQLPNAVPTMGGMIAGGGAGMIAGGPIGAVVGGGIGMFLGTSAIETGAMAQAKTADGFSQQDRKDALLEGGAKSGVITAFDIATLYTNKLLGGMPGKAAYAAVSKFLGDKGVDVASQVAVRTALADKALLSGAMDVAQKTVRGAAQTPRIMAGIAAESVGEGAGEYFGEMAAGHDPSIREALLEGALSLPQSVAETAIGRALNKKNAAIEQISGKSEGQLQAEQATGVLPDTPIATALPSTTQAQADSFNEPVTPRAQSETAVDPVTARGDVENPYSQKAPYEIKGEPKAKPVKEPAAEEMPTSPADAKGADVDAALSELSGDTAVEVATDGSRRISAQTMDSLGILPQAITIRKTIAGLDLNVPEQAETIKVELAKHHNNEMVDPATKENIKRFLQAENKAVAQEQQTELSPPAKPPVTKTAPVQGTEEAKNEPTTATDQTGSGAGTESTVSDTGEGAAVPAKPAVAVKSKEPVVGVLGVSDKSSGAVGAGAGGADVTLEQGKPWSGSVFHKALTTEFDLENGSTTSAAIDRRAGLHGSLDKSVAETFDYEGDMQEIEVDLKNPLVVENTKSDQQEVAETIVRGGITAPWLKQFMNKKGLGWSDKLAKQAASAWAKGEAVKGLVPSTLDDFIKEHGADINDTVTGKKAVDGLVESFFKNNPYDAIVYKNNNVTETENASDKTSIILPKNAKKKLAAKEAPVAQTEETEEQIDAKATDDADAAAATATVVEDVPAPLTKTEKKKAATKKRQVAAKQAEVNRWKELETDARNEREEAEANGDEETEASAKIDQTEASVEREKAEVELKELKTKSSAADTMKVSKAPKQVKDDESKSTSESMSTAQRENEELEEPAVEVEPQVSPEVLEERVLTALNTLSRNNTPTNVANVKLAMSALGSDSAVIDDVNKLLDNLKGKKTDEQAAAEEAEEAEDKPRTPRRRYATGLDKDEPVLSDEEFENKDEWEVSPPVSAAAEAEVEGMTTAQKKKVQVSGHSVPIAGVHYTLENPTESDYVTLDDYKKVTSLIEKKPSRNANPLIKAAYLYFNDGRRIIDNLSDVAWDLAFRPKKNTLPHAKRILSNIGYEAMTHEEYVLHQQKGGEIARKAAEWIDANLSDKAKAEFANKMSAKAKEYVKVSGFDSERFDAENETDGAPVKVADSEQLIHQNKMTEAFLEHTKQVFGEVTHYKKGSKELAALIAEDPEGFATVTAALMKNGKMTGSLSLPLSAINASDLSIPPYAMSMLERGDLAGALAVIADSSPNALVGRIASEIGKKIGTTKISVLKDVKNDSGKSIAGSFNPKTNTIKLRAGDVPTHVLLHEAAHAVLSKTLDNPSHRTTKKLNKLYESVKDELSGYYGSESLDEFISEAMSNPRFQQELASLYADRKSDKGALRQLFDAVLEYFTKLFNINSTGTYAQFNDMIIGLMAPAPEYRGAGEYYMLSQQDELDSLVTEAAKGEKASMKKFKGRTTSTTFEAMQSTVFHDMSLLGKRAGFGFLQSVSMADYTEKFGINGTKELHHMFQRMEAAVTTGQHPLDAFINKLNKWNKEGKLLKIMASDHQRAKTEIMNRVIPEMTVWEVNALLPKNVAKKKYKGDKDKLAKYDELQASMNALGEDGREIIQNYWDAFSHMKKELIAGLEQTINDSVEDPVIRKQLKDKVFKDLLSKANIDPYSPLWRSGKFWLEFIDRDNNEQGTVYETFKTQGARTRRMVELEQLEKDTKDDKGGSEVYGIRPYEKPTLENFEKAPPTKFVKDAMAIFDKAQVPAETKKMFMDLFIDSLPETSFAKSFQKRKGSRGYETDALGTFQHTAYGLNRQIQQLKHHKSIRNQLNKVHTSAEKFNKENQSKSGFAQKINTSKALLEEWDARAKFALMPDSNWQATASRWANRFAFMWTIGFGPSSAIINTGQLPMVVYPFQAVKTDPKTAYKAMMTAGAFVLSAGREHQVELLGTKNHERFTHKALSPSGDNYYIHDYATNELTLADENKIDNTKPYYDGMTKRELAKMLTPFIKYISEEGQLERTVAYDAMGLELSGKDKNIGEHVSIMGAWMFHTGERLNRQVALIGSYLNELKKIEKETGKRPEQLRPRVLQKAMETALHDTQYTNGGSMLQTAPRWAQKNIGRVAMMYKSFGVGMYTLQGKLLHTALKDSSASKADKILAGKQFMAINGMVALMSGLQGITLFGMYAGVANLFRDDDDEDVETTTRKAVGEEVYKGGINYLTKIFGGEGVDVAARIGLSNLIISHDRYNFDPSPEKSFVKTIGGPFYGSVSSVGRGIASIGEGEYQRGVEALLPAGIRNMAKALPFGLGRYSQEGIRTRRGDPIMGDLDGGLLAAQFLGFAPAEYTRNQERAQSIKGIDRAVTETKTKLLRKLYVTQRFGEDATNIMEEIVAFNRKWPQMAIDWKTVKASRKKHRETSQKMFNGVLLSPDMRNHLFGLAQEWDNGWNPDVFR